MIVQLNIGVEFDVSEKETNREELQNLLEAALRYSSAAEAIGDAFAEKYGEDVEFAGWWVQDEKPNLAEVVASYAGHYLRVGGVIVALQGDKCREILPEEACEPIPEDELANASIGGKPAKDIPTSIVRFFRGDNWTKKSLQWVADRINAVAEGKAKPYSQAEVDVK